MKKVWLIRHPEREKDSFGLCCGHTDVNISENGKRTVSQIVKMVRDFVPDRIISSDLKRCRFLADSIARKWHLPIEYNAHWRELNFGKWEGKNWNVIYRSEPQRLEKWGNDFVESAPPQGESLMELQQRVFKALNQIQGRVVVVTHEGPIRAILCKVQLLPLNQAFSIPVPFGSVFSLGYDGNQWFLNSTNLLEKI